MTNALVVALGIILAAAGPVLILVLNSRNKVRQYVYGTARVADISPRPTTDGRTARGRLKLVVRATGINGVTVSTVDPAIPLDKWPDAGATLPVQVLKGNPRKLAVVWDKVQSHQDAQASERRPSGGGGPRYSVDGDELDIVDSPTDDYERERERARVTAGGAVGGPAGAPARGPGGGSVTPFERPAEDLPPDNRPTLTDLPPIAAPVIEPVRLSGRGDRTGQTRPAQRPTSPAPGGTGDPAGTSGFAAPAAVAFTKTGSQTTGSPTASASSTATGSPTASASPASAGGQAATGEHALAGEHAGVGTVTAAPVSGAGAADPAADAQAAHAGVVTEDTPPMVVRLPSNPVRGGARRRPSPRPRPGTHDHAPARTVEPAVAPAPEETPAAVTEAAPSYTIPEAGSTLSPPPDLPSSDLPPAAADHSSDEPSEQPSEQAAAEQTAEHVSVQTPELTPAVQEVETAVEGGVEQSGDEPTGSAALPSGITWWPDRETEQLPTRLPRLEHLQAHDAEPPTDTTPTDTTPSDPAPADSDPTDTDTADTDTAPVGGTDESAIVVGPAPVVGSSPVLGPSPSGPPTPLRSANEAAAGDPASNGNSTVRPWGTGDAGGPTTSAWSSNGHSRDATAPGTGVFGAAPAWPTPGTALPGGSGDDDDEEPVAPNPYATEHYVGDSPEDQLEEQPPSEGAVGQFLATEQRQQPNPLDGVNGVSITLIVSDLERSRRFYRDTLGLTELDSGDAAAVLATGDARVVLRRVADMPPVDRRVVHLNLEVPDVYEAYERLREQGVDFVHRPRVVPQGEQLELCSATFRDPDGHAIALTRWELRR
ncbi:VOC family protein [Dactylosporangium sp. NPDC049742]|uniref:VOC family protein n=1 Tax=Dactylosporangium sp. NPDC049742 TaxID=3154737 RepID=UPI00342FE774